MTLFILYEFSVGYALFKLKNFDEANTNEKNVQSQIADFETFSTIANLVVFTFFYIGFLSIWILLSCALNHKLYSNWQSPFKTDRFPLRKSTYPKEK